jgi:hypothetical protein
MRLLQKETDSYIIVGFQGLEMICSKVFQAYAVDIQIFSNSHDNIELLIDVVI